MTRTPLSSLLPKALSLLVALGASFALVPSASAQDDEVGRTVQLRPSFRYTRSAGDETTHGFGLDLELNVYPLSAPWRYGAFLAGDLMLDGSQRVAAGLNAGYGVFGIQVGVAQRTAEGQYAASTGLHLAKTLTIGPVGVALRMTIPLASQRSQGRIDRGFEHAFRLSLGWSFDLVGRRPAMGHMCGHHHEH